MDDRFEKVYSQGMMTIIEIWVDKLTGVNYLYRQSGYSGGLTPLLDKDGKPHGMGVWELEDGTRYEGACVHGWREGKGVLMKPDGTRLEGWFEKDEYVGQERPENTKKE